MRKKVFFSLSCLYCRGKFVSLIQMNYVNNTDHIIMGNEVVINEMSEKYNYTYSYIDTKKFAITHHNNYINISKTTTNWGGLQPNTLG